MSLSFNALIESITMAGNGHQVNIPENWMQGRTAYGGLSAALCLESVLKQYSELPPLRSAQINFIGPAGGDVSLHNEVLRRGKSVSFIESKASGEKGLATQAVFCFGGERESLFDRDFTQAPICAGVEDSGEFFKLGPGPAFSTNFECLSAQGGVPLSGSEANEHYVWIRFKEDVPINATSLLAIGDMPPPAVLPMLKTLAPISSMSWMVNFVQDEPKTKDGWWLMRTCAEHAKQSYSSQDMQIWNSDRQLVLTGRQNVAIFI